MENRYDKYKDSGIAWIGEIPEHWVMGRIKNIIHTYKAGPFGSSLITSNLNNIGKYVTILFSALTRMFPKPTFAP